MVKNEAVLNEELDPKLVGWFLIVIGFSMLSCNCCNVLKNCFPLCCIIYTGVVCVDYDKFTCLFILSLGCSHE